MWTDTLCMWTHVTVSCLWQGPDKWKTKRKKLQIGQWNTSKFKWKIQPPFSSSTQPPLSNASVLHSKNDNTSPETHTHRALHWEVWEAIIDHISLLISLVFQITKQEFHTSVTRPNLRSVSPLLSPEPAPFQRAVQPLSASFTTCQDQKSTPDIRSHTNLYARACTHCPIPSASHKSNCQLSTFNDWTKEALWEKHSERK